MSKPTSKLLAFPVPEQHKQVWYTWGPVLGRYEPFGVELLRDTKNGNWFIVTPQSSSTVPFFVAQLSTDEIELPALPEAELDKIGNSDEERRFARVVAFMEWLMQMLKRHA